MSISLSQIQKPGGYSAKTGSKDKETISFWKKDISFGKKLTDKRKEEFYSELSILINSGLDLKSSLDIIVREQKQVKLKSIFNDLADKILHGASFAEAISGFKEFGTYEFYSLKIGEESGRFVEVLDELTLYFRKKLKQRKQLMSAFSYPLLIFLTAFAAVFFMMNFIVPLFADAFLRFNSELPGLTKGVIVLSETFRAYWLFIPLIFAVLYLAYRSFRSKEWFRKGATGILLRIPVLGPLMQKFYLARFCQSMALMTGARTPLIKALDLVKRMIRLYPVEVALEKMQQDIYHGKTLNESMEQFSIFESRMVSLIKVGEETNQLDAIFKRLYDQYSEDADHQTAMLSSMLEPLLIILVGGMVAVILVAMYLPMFKLGSSLMGA
jgi:type IV pilus assembly protein PilC